MSRSFGWKDKLLVRIGETVGPLLIGIIARTLRLQKIDEHYLNSVRAERKAWVFAVVHGRMFVPVWFHRNQGITTLVSQSKDGEMVARLVNKIGHITERGSSHRGAASGLRKMISAIKRGPVAMMVDGPKGPREEVKIGSIAIARMGKVPIVPMIGAAEKYWEFGSWDRFQLPKPFSKAYIIYGEPYVLPGSLRGDDEMEVCRLELQRRVIACRERVDRIARGKETV